MKKGIVKEEELKDYIYWLKLVFCLAAKERARLEQAGRDNLGLDFDFTKISRKKLKEYTAISTEERMRKDDMLRKQEMAVGFAMEAITNEIFMKSRAKLQSVFSPNLTQAIHNLKTGGER